MARSRYSQAFLDSVKDGFDDANALGRIGRWLCRNTRIKGRPFSFKDHEFQEAIVDSLHHNQCTMKPSQCGLTEVENRKVLAFLNIEFDAKALILLPTVAKAQKMMKSRMDLVIAESPVLDSALSVGGDSASFKQFGRSQLFLAGTFGQATISDDIDFLFIDEYDFCNQENLATANSRLQHSRFQDPLTGERGIIHAACTPTVAGYGIDLLFSTSDQRRYLAKCPHCGTWFAPSYLEHVRIPSFHDPLETLTWRKVQALDEGGFVDKAFLRCPVPRCSQRLTAHDLRPENREWVAAYPSRTHQEGWAVSPLDLPKYHTPPTILRKLLKYKSRVNHYYNFVLGLPYSDANNSVLDAVVEANCVLSPVPPDLAGPLGVAYTVMGLDVGLTSHLLVAVPDPSTGRLDVIWAERIAIPAADACDTLRATVLERVRQFNCRLLVADHRPYAPTMNAIRAALNAGWMYPNNYELSDRHPLDYTIDAASQTIKSNRTAVMNETARYCNAGLARFLAHAVETPILRQQLQGTKRIDEEDEHGNLKSQWVKTGPHGDHYYHALGMVIMASKMLDTAVTAQVSAVPSIRSALVGSRYTPQPDTVPTW